MAEEVKAPARPAQRLLALDAAGAACSAAVWAGGQVAARRFEAMNRGQSERLVPMIEDAMSEAGIAFGDLDAVAVTLGPGGFTGVRIGLATARALALALACPLLGVTNFEAVAAAVPPETRADGHLVVAIDAKRSDVYLQVLDRQLQAVTEPAAMLPDKVAEAMPDGPLILVGDAAPTVAVALETAGRSCTLAPGDGLTDAARVAALAAVRPLPPRGSAMPTPLYLRGPDVTLPRKRPFGARPAKSSGPRRD